MCRVYQMTSLLMAATAGPYDEECKALKVWWPNARRCPGATRFICWALFYAGTVVALGKLSVGHATNFFCVPATQISPAMHQAFKMRISARTPFQDSPGLCFLNKLRHPRRPSCRSYRSRHKHIKVCLRVPLVFVLEARLGMHATPCYR